VDLFCLGRKFLVYNMVSRNLKTKYRRSVFGVFWTVLTPFAMGTVYYFVFKLVLKIQIPHYVAFIMSGVLPWTFFSQTLMEGMESIVGNWALVTKVPIPLQTFPFTGALTNLVTLILAVPILLVAALVSDVHLGFSLVLLPVYFVLIFLLAYGFALILSITFVFFRDLRHLMGIVMQIWFYATPVVYSEAMIPARFRWVFWINPVAPVLSGIRSILVEGAWPDAGGLVAGTGWAFATIGACAVIQKRWSHGVVEQL
jgi:ABC-type polysaccharide/polyol phosphate export permease